MYGILYTPTAKKKTIYAGYADKFPYTIFQPFSKKLAY